MGREDGSEEQFASDEEIADFKKRINESENPWGAGKTVADFWNRPLEKPIKYTDNRKSGNGYLRDPFKGESRFEKEKDDSRIEAIKKSLAELDVEISLARLSRNDKWYQGLLVIEKDLLSRLKESEGKDALDGYKKKWNGLREQIKKAESMGDEEAVANLEKKIRELENGHAAFIAQTQAMLAEQAASEAAAEGREIPEELRAYDILMRRHGHNGGKSEPEQVADKADRLVEKVDEALEREQTDKKAEKIISKSSNLTWRQKLAQKMRRPFLVGLTFLSSMAPGKAGAQSVERGPGEGVPVATSMEGIPAQFKRAFEQSKKGKFKNLKNWRVHFNTLYERHEDGTHSWNPEAILFPAYLEMPSTARDSGMVKADIPYEYARLFDIDPAAKKNLNPADYQKMEEYVRQQLQHQLVDSLRSLTKQDNLSTRRTRFLHGEEESHRPKIKSITIQGFASPEGHFSKGAESIRPGVVDEENIKLAAARAAGGYEALKGVLKEYGISEAEFAHAAKTLKPEEIQFSDQEMVTLAQLASKEQGLAEDEKIFNLIVKYNNGEIKDQKVIDQLNQIVGSKRKIEIKVDYENDSKNYLTIAIPLILLALPALRRRRRIPEEGEGGKPVPEGGKGKDDDERRFMPPIVPPLKEGGKEKFIPPEKVKIPERITKVEMWAEQSEQYRHAEYETYVNDLWVYFDDEESIRRGVDYRDICERLEEVYDDFVGKDTELDREYYLTYTILQVWRDHDINARREAGWTENLDQWLEYEKNEDQVRWARMHAKGLLKVIEAHRSDKKSDYLDLLKAEAAKILEAKQNADLEKELGDRRTARKYRPVGIKKEPNLDLELEDALTAARAELEKATESAPKKKVEVNAAIRVDMNLSRGAKEESAEKSEQKEEKEKKLQRLSVKEVEAMIKEQLNDQKDVKVQLVPLKNGAKLDVSFDGGFGVGKVKVSGLVENSGTGLNIRNLEVKAGLVARGAIKSKFEALNSEARKYFEKRFGRKINSIRIEGQELVIGTA